MRSLLLLRHAKSDWDAGEQEDHLRPLTGRGRRAAATMGRFLSAAGPLPDLALTSPTVRAEETLRIAADTGGWGCRVRVEPAFYGCGPEEALAALRQVANEEQVVMAVGHEPAWSALAGLLTGGSRLAMPTAAMARIDSEIDAWSELDLGCGVLVWLVTPRALESLR